MSFSTSSPRTTRGKEGRRKARDFRAAVAQAAKQLDANPGNGLSKFTYELVREPRLNRTLRATAPCLDIYPLSLSLSLNLFVREIRNNTRERNIENNYIRRKQV